jgi:hypothetical protein
MGIVKKVLKCAIRHAIVGVLTAGHGNVLLLAADAQDAMDAADGFAAAGDYLDAADYYNDALDYQDAMDHDLQQSLAKQGVSVIPAIESKLLNQ